MRPTSAFSGFIDGFKELVAQCASDEALVAYCETHFAGGGERIFWERLLAGEYRDAASLRDDAVARGIALAPSYVPVILELDLPAELNDLQALARERAQLRHVAVEAFANMGSGLGTLERGSGIVAFVPAARESDARKARTGALLLPKVAAKATRELRFFAAVGECVPAIELARGIAQAETALAIGRRIFGTERVAVYDALGVYPLLFEGADVQRLQAFALRTLAPLRTYDEKHQTELELTLRVYFAVGQNVKTASERLHVHRHTVFYRLRQISDICGCSLDDERDQLTLRIAMAIATLHNAAPLERSDVR